MEYSINYGMKNLLYHLPKKKMMNFSPLPQWNLLVKSSLYCAIQNMLFLTVLWHDSYSLPLTTLHLVASKTWQSSGATLENIFQLAKY